MCGRYAIISAPEAIRRLLAYLDQPNFPARYNVAPTQPIPIVRMLEGQRRFALVRWGLVPSWVKEPKDFTLIINARGESVNDKPAFRHAMRYRRCLIPADGFYEWKAERGGKRPYFIAPKSGGPFAFAGLWEAWIGPNGEEIETAAIVTTAANATLSSLHERMPVILEPSHYEDWLNCRRVDHNEAAALIRPLADDALTLQEVAIRQSVDNDSPELIAPVPANLPLPQATTARRSKEQSDSRQGSLF